MLTESGVCGTDFEAHATSSSSKRSLIRQCPEKQNDVKERNQSVEDQRSEGLWIDQEGCNHTSEQPVKHTFAHSRRATVWVAAAPVGLPLLDNRCITDPYLDSPAF